ncbi:NPCBM-associated, NEW3 domain of alpha-galactosidase [Streptomyces prasinopilosus]|uniref:NPCBM-associated, NEW3 domain of alpha-galactosidase n=2 Tax=Streptomyces prasinopilosus TaxID=67344 RepID=A0A1G6MJS9_9ACTN|nr:NPCBM-associated, NEW3 domain of alpha-galactosidase [Streptomyces prasinopilosus]
MGIARWTRPLGAVAVAAAMTLVPAPAATAAGPPPGSAAARTEVSISSVDLDGPAVSTVEVTVKNTGPQRMRSLKVAFSGPAGWAVQPALVDVPGTFAAGAAATAEFRIQVPEKRRGFTLRTFTATATYAGGDGGGSASGTRTQASGTPLANLAAAYNNVGITDESDTGPGDYDGEGNSFSAQRLAAAGLTPGGRVRALGAELTWPDVAPGTKDNVSGAGQAIALSGKGGALVLLGSGVTGGATGTVTVYYTDGTSTSGSFGFPNWSFDPADAHGATLVASSDGRNRQDGYGNQGIAYRVFAHSVALDAAKQVEFVVLPANGNVHVFDMAIAP